MECDLNIAEHTCISCEHRSAFANDICAACHTLTNNLVLFSTRLANEDAVKVHRMCPSCASKAQARCINCNRHLDKHRENFMCLACTAGLSFNSDSSAKMPRCKDCGNRGYINVEGVCKNCFKKRFIKGVYMVNPVIKKCLLCDEPALPQSDPYCSDCAIMQLNTCAHKDCTNFVQTNQRMCKLHAYTCWGCAKLFDPIRYTDLCCPICVKKAIKDNECQMCRKELDTEAEYKLYGVCDSCYETNTKSIYCRRCETTKGYELCPPCVEAQPPCRCGNSKQADSIICDTCLYEQRPDTSGGL